MCKLANPLRSYIVILSFPGKFLRIVARLDYANVWTGCVSQRRSLLSNVDAR